MPTYTSHKLTDAQLKRLHPIVHGKPHRYGMSLVALENKELVKSVGSGFKYEATQAGIDALAQARSEGW